MRYVRIAMLCALLLGCERAPVSPSSGSPPPAEAPPAIVAEPPAAHLFDDLGTLHRAISTTNAEAQRWFDQGLRLAYAFNHEAAGRAFAQAERLDPGCAICAWGQALVLGPNINMPMVPEAAAPAWTALQRAVALENKASPVERALIAALAQRYAPTPPEDRKPLDQAYANAMREVVARFPEDLDAATMFAESLMDLSPWAYWNEDGGPNTNTDELVAALEAVLARAPDHIGAIHYYIHAIEASPAPQRAEAHADRLAALSPGAGHLVHMPAHIYIRVGRYHDASLNNLKATEADGRFLSFCKGSNGIYPLGYVPHNWHFMAMSASLEGNAERALHAAQQTAQRVDMTQLVALSFMQQFVVTPLFYQVRFARWDEILAASAAPAALPFPRAIWHYARGRALAAKGEVEAATKELEALAIVAQDPTLPTTILWDINAASNVVKVAVESLRATVAAARGDQNAALAAWQAAVVAEDALNYTEPPDWPLPVRHELGAALLAASYAAEAEAVFRADLANYPKNGWSLRGLEAALAAQDKTAEAKTVHGQFEQAWQWADIKTESSRL